MNENIWLRIKRWWCERRGHNAKRESNGDEFCTRCGRFMSTTYSRRRDGHE